LRPGSCIRIPLFTLGIALAIPLLAPDLARASIEIVSPTGVLERFVTEREGRTFLDVEGMSWELVTDPNDPAISRLGDGSFHPMSPVVVREAIQGMDRTALSIEGQVLILPYPRRTNLKSSCEGSIVFLSPGIREVAPEHVHATTIHELGHLVQRSFAREGSAAWEQYLDRRKLRDTRYSPGAIHRDRPREIFAEDFRFLFGTSLATSSGSIENPDLPLPSAVPGLEAWFEELLRNPRTEAVAEDTRGARAFPNPFRRSGSSTIEFASMSPAVSMAPSSAIIVDLGGRRVRTLSGGADVTGSETTFHWDGRDDDGAFLPTGTYFVRCSGAPGTARVHFLR
jgi:hypothetical protein